MQKIGHLIWFSIRVVGAAVIGWMLAFIACIGLLVVNYQLQRRLLYPNVLPNWDTFLFRISTCIGAALAMLWAARRISRNAPSS